MHYAVFIYDFCSVNLAHVLGPNRRIFPVLMLNPSFPVTDPVIAYMHRYYIVHVFYHAALSFPPESLVKELPRSLRRFSMQKEMSPCNRAQ